MASKVWVVREDTLCGPGMYFLVSSCKPYKRKSYWVTRRHSTLMCDPREFEAVFPKHWHLPPGGGPVEIKFQKPKETT